MAQNINKLPKISVIMSVYNGSKYIDDAIESILNQTFKNFEFIIVNDGSTDDSLIKIKKYKDPRIRIINQDNKGLVSSLNNAISISKADIIARQDADDVSNKDRFLLELQTLEQNPGNVLVGSSIITIDENSSILNTHKVLLNNPELKQELLVRSPFAHGSVIFLKSAFKKAEGYTKSDWPAEDYGLWLRMSKFGDFQNVDTPLYRYRENSAGISSTNETLQTKMKSDIQNRAWKFRKPLLLKINTQQYLKLEMGEYRIDRILENLVLTLKKSLRSFKFITVFKILLIIASDKLLFKKSIRILFSKLK